MVSDRDFIFHIYIPWGKPFSLVPKSQCHLLGSNIKVTVFEKKNLCGGSGVSQAHLVSMYVITATKTSSPPRFVITITVNFFRCHSNGCTA